MNKLTMILTTATTAALMITGVVAEEQSAPKDEQAATVKTAVPAQPTPTPSPDAVATSVLQQISGPNTNLFQPMNVDPALVRASMQARSEYDALNRKIVARQQKIYEENPTIQKIQANMRELQEQIDKILASDEELMRLNDKFKSISPQMPSGKKQSLPAPSGPPDAKE